MYKRLVLVAALVFIFLFQTTPVTDSPKIIGLDKIVHFFTYLILLFILLWNGFSIVFSVVFSILYGILMEIVQIPVPGRECSFYDFLANCAGIFVSLFIAKKFGFWIQKR